MKKQKQCNNNFQCSNNRDFLSIGTAYGLGSQLFESTNTPEKYLGASLIIANSVMVLLIGILLRKNIETVQSNSWEYLSFYKNI